MRQARQPAVDLARKLEGLYAVANRVVLTAGEDTGQEVRQLDAVGKLPQARLEARPGLGITTVQEQCDRTAQMRLEPIGIQLDCPRELLGGLAESTRAGERIRQRLAGLDDPRHQRDRPLELTDGTSDVAGC